MARRIVVVDDVEEVRAGLADLIDTDPDFTVAGVAASAEEALAAVDRCAADLVLADLILGVGPHGIQLTTGIKARHPLLPVLILSARPESTFAEQAVLAGAAGYLMKEDAANILFDAMHVAARGELWLSSAMRNHLLPAGITASGTPDQLEDRLAASLIRELRRGNRSLVGLARTLNMAQPAVEHALEGMRKHLGLPSRAALYLVVG